MINIKFPIRKAGLILFAALLFTTISSAATFTAVASGNWSSTTTWGGTAPSSTITTDIIVIPSAYTVSMDANVTLNGVASELEVEGTLTGTSGITLLVTTGLISGSGNISVGHITLGLAAIVSFNGNITADYFENDAVKLKNNAKVTVNKNLSVLTGILSLETGSSLSLGSGTAIVIAGGSLVNNGGTLVLTSPYSVTYITAGAVAGLELSGNGLSSVTIDVTSGKTVTLISDLLITGTLSLKTGTLDLGTSSLKINGDIAANGNGNIKSSATSNISLTSSQSMTGDLTFGGTTNDVNNFTMDIGTGNYAKTSGNLAVKGTLNLMNGTLDIKNASLTLNGEIAANTNGMLLAGSTTNIVVGTSGTSLGSLTFATGGNTVKNFTVNTIANGSVVLNSSLIVGGTLSLMAGTLKIGSNDLTIATTGAISGGSSASYIATAKDGFVVMSLVAGANAVNYPIGTYTTYYPAALSLASTSGSGNIKANVTSHVFAQGTTGTVISTTKSMVDATWDIQTDVTANLNLSMKLMWPATSEVNNFDRNTAYITHYTNSNWDVSAQGAATLQTNGMFSIGRANLTSLSPFTVFDRNTSGIEQNTNSNDLANVISIYPNPATNRINIQSSGNNGAYADIINQDGRVLGSTKINGTNTAMDVSTLPAGVYYIKFYDNTGSKLSKFVKM